MTQVNMLQAKTELSKLIMMLENKDETEIYIARNGVPVATLSLYDNSKHNVEIGKFEGKFDVPDDFDDCNIEILKMMGE